METSELPVSRVRVSTGKQRWLMSRPSQCDAGCDARRGVAAVELALLLPLLLLISVVAVDFARVFSTAVVIQNCARNAAMFSANPKQAEKMPYVTAEEAMLAEAADLSPPPTLVVKPGTDAHGKYVDVTVSYNFSMITSYISAARIIPISRSVRMRVTEVDEDE